jgi:hypothetical protein
MVGINKLAQNIERVGFVARQFTLWVVLEDWFNSEQEPNFGDQAIMVYFLGYTLLFAPAIVKCIVYTMHFVTAIVKCTVYIMHFAMAIVKCIVYTMHFATAIMKCIVYYIIGGVIFNSLYPYIISLY